MTLSELADLATRDVGDTDGTTVQFAKDVAKKKYEDIYNGHNWREANDLFGPLTLATSATDLFLPLDFEKALWLKASFDSGTTYIELKYRERGWIERNDSASFYSVSGDRPRFYYQGKSLGWPELNPLKITITPVASETSIVSTTIEGTETSTGIYRVETFSITGAAPVQTTYSYSSISNISKAVSTQQFTFTSQVPTSVTMQPNDTSLRYTRLVIFPAYALGSTLIKGEAKLKVDSLLSDNSVPRISNINDALYYFVRGALRGRQKASDLELSDLQLANTFFEQAKKLEMEQAGGYRQIVPKIFDDPAEVWNTSGDNDGYWW